MVIEAAEEAHDYITETLRLEALARARECLAFELAAARAEAPHAEPYKPGPLEW